jgi:probable rRNA maturation factor
VISFGFARASDKDAVVGDIYIAPEVARDNAADRGIGVREEIVRLLVHGTLHVLGRDHPEGSDEARRASPMWRRQEALVRRVIAGNRGRA